MEERRKYPRFEAPCDTVSKVKSSISARIVDISQGGVLLELGTSLRPASTCDITVPTVDGELRLKAIVRRCRALSIPTDEGLRMVFRAGLEFSEIGEHERAAIAATIGPSASTAELAGDTPLAASA
jgi:c-di-GMP-binding flagellar brake protein YcgR